MSTRKPRRSARYWRRLYERELQRSLELERQRHQDLIRRLDKAQRSMDEVVLPGLAKMAEDFQRWSQGAE